MKKNKKRHSSPKDSSPKLCDLFDFFPSGPLTVKAKITCRIIFICIEVGII